MGHGPDSSPDGSPDAARAVLAVEGRARRTAWPRLRLPEECAVPSEPRLWVSFPSRPIPGPLGAVSQKVHVTKLQEQKVQGGSVSSLFSVFKNENLGPFGAHSVCPFSDILKFSPKRPQDGLKHGNNTDRTKQPSQGLGAVVSAKRL